MSTVQPPKLPQVLIVDDDDDIRLTIHAILHEEAYQLHEATNGAVALKFLDSADFPVVALLDLYMPRMSGLEVLRALHAQPRRPQQRYILLTARYNLPTADLAMLHELQVNILLKPFELNTLLTTVAAAVADLGTA